jgi:hypothetical protein
MASSPPVLTPEQIAELQAGAALMQNRLQTGINVPGGLMIGQPGQLSAAGSGLAGSLYDYAQTAPVLSLQGNRDWETLNFQALPGTNYRLTVGGEVLGTASTPEEVARLVQAANDISERGGAKVDVRLQQEIQTANPDGTPATAFSDVYANRENNTGALGTILPAGLALVSAGTLAPVFAGAGLGGAVSTGLAAGLGSAAGSLGTGSSLKDALIKGGITAITAGGLQGLGVGVPGVDTKIGSTVATKAGSAVGSTVANQAAQQAVQNLAEQGLIEVVAKPILGNLASSAVGAGLGSIGSSLAQPTQFDDAMELARMQNQYSVPMPGDDALITAIGQRIPQSTIGGSVPGFAGGAASTLLPDLTQFITNPPAQQQAGAGSEDDFIDVAGQRIPKVAVSPALAAVPAIGGAAALASGAGAPQNLLPQTQQAPPTAGEYTPLPGDSPLITVGSGTGGAAIPPAAIAVPAAAAATAALASSTGAPTNLLDQLADPSAYSGQETAAKSTSGKSGAAKAIQTANTIKGGIALAAGLGNALGLFGGGGSGSSGAGGIGGLGGGFNDLVAVQPFNRTRNPATFDPFTYGQYGGQFRFFGDERPQFQIGIGAPTVPGPNAGIAPQPEVPIQVKRGGPIRGIGGGQDDKIPAMLSDGEYVFSAQDVADLGDGSNDEGARRLDEMRKLIRKQAGRRNTKTIAKPQKSVSSLLRAAR